ncbi:TIGR01459 family HAD-type hydrolase [Algicella marina]|uniref:TIGR01459 family HAD-type hydrolase n=1 Tax=Algicella marina TaxID=2683284 RepID=A0A6P1SYY1_9RHOB|nr:TIGR01459 family HAD-type hydrolase [Algicella marina]QHQ35894.1 TIGR01459 family HAD-type hydrolase [Algicella marina]
MTPIISSLSEIGHRYDVLFCDLWGCFHNGVTVFPDAVAALQSFRQSGGTVVLVTNSPRPRASVASQIADMGAPDDSYDAIASSGDAAQSAMAAGHYGRKVFHIGPERDLPFFTDETGTPYDIERVPLEEAEGIVCTGLFDDRTETPDDYRLIIATGVNRGLKMLCANPDVIVDVGDQRIYCAGAIAEAYAAAGGTAHYYGKPHAPIYQLARLRAEQARGEEIRDQNILCIGDGIQTDVKGAVGEGLDVLFIAGGLAAEETGMSDGTPDASRTEAYLAEARLTATAAMGFLR